MVFGEEDHRSEALFSSHCIKGMCYQHDLLLSTLTSIAWFEVVFVRFPAVRLLPPPVFLHNLLFENMSIGAAHTQKVDDLGLY